MQAVRMPALVEGRIRSWLAMMLYFQPDTIVVIGASQSLRTVLHNPWFSQHGIQALTTAKSLGDAYERSLLSC